jgi:hypothetical protein
MTQALFPLGHTMATPGFLGVVGVAASEEAQDALTRHASGDWGNCCSEDTAHNDAALKDGGRLMSVYEAKDGTEFWVITEADRSVTTVLLPEDY